MSLDIIFGPDVARGRVRSSAVLPQGTTQEHGVILPGTWDLKAPWQHNDLLYEWAHIVTTMMRNEPDGKNYSIGGMYIEFDNSGSAAAVPTVARDESLSYYNNLNISNSDQDYLRVPLIATTSANSDSATFALDNKAIFYAQTEGATGIHGLAFGTGSKVFGCGLVAYRSSADASQDLIFSRSYFATANQLDKATGSQIGITWDIQLS